MPDVHLIQWAIVFAAAVYITCKWLLDRPASRWRHIAATVVGALLWIPVAYTAGNVGVADGGEVVAFGSEAIAGVAVFMIVVNVAGLLLGLMLWAEEEVDEASSALPSEMRRGPRG